MRNIGVLSVMGTGLAAAAAASRGGILVVESRAQDRALDGFWPASPAIIHGRLPVAGKNGKRHGTPREFRPTGTKRQRQRRRMI